MAAIWINGHKLEPDSQLEGGEYFAADASHSNYILLHCAAPLSLEQQATVQKLHVSILKYVSVNTYLCRYEPDDVEAIRALPFVLFANVYHQDLAISAALKSNIAASAVSDSIANGSISGIENGGTESKTSESSEQAKRPINVSISLHPYSKRSPSEIKQDLEHLLKVSSDAIEVFDGIIRLSIRPEDLSKVASMDEVRSINESHPLVKHCVRVHRDINIPASMIGVAAGVLNGTGEIVAILESDSFDRGRFEVGIPIHPAFTWPRVQFDPFPTRARADYADHQGHGTMVAGCVAANGRVGTFFRQDGKGTAPNATILIHAFPTAPTFTTLFNMALNTNVPPTRPNPRNTDSRPAYIYNISLGASSWRDGTPGQLINLAYDDAVPIDTYLNNISRELLVVWSAGNDGAHPGATLGGVQSAKNVLTVGAVESSYPLQLGGPDGQRPIVMNPLIVRANTRGDPNIVANFSSPGPANGRVGGLRIKPDVVAPGIVLSCRSSEPGDLSYWTTSAAGVNPPVIDYAKFGASPDAARWLYAGGTSFSAPFVSGVAAILRKALIRYRFFDHPTSALLKAVIIHGAQDIRAAGPPARRADHGWAPNMYQGWGRVNVQKSLDAIMYHATCIMVNFSATLQQGQRDPYDMLIPAGQTATLIATMVFTDRPDDVCQSSMVLLADWNGHGPGVAVRRYANKNENDPTHDFTTPDLINNVQKIVWSNLAGPGTIEIAVEARAVTAAPAGQPAFPGQDYTLVFQVAFN